MYRTIDTCMWSDPKVRQLPAPAKLMQTVQTWTDDIGNVWRVPPVKYKLRYTKWANHAALRAFVHRRDGFTCRRCGRRPKRIPLNYDGRSAVTSRDHTLIVVDHILSRRLGGTNHPDNLQTLCDPCNARKSCFEEGAGRVNRCATTA